MQQQTEIVEGSNQSLVRPTEGMSVVREQRHPSVVSPVVVETDFAELEDGSIVDAIEDPENSSRTLLAIYKAGQTLGSRKIQRFRFLTCKTNISEQRQLVFGLYRLQTEKEKSAQIVELSFEGMSVCAESRNTESNP